MAEYLIQEETLTNLGDQIRVLSGTEDTMTPSVMTTNVDEANSEISSQAELLAQAVAALEGKSAGSGSDASLETCTVTFTTESLVHVYSFAYTSFVDGNISYEIHNVYDADFPSAQFQAKNVVCGTVVSIECMATTSMHYYQSSGAVSVIGTSPSSVTKWFLVGGDGTIDYVSNEPA